MTELITRLLHAVDARDWDTACSLFTDEVRTDYTALWGGEPATVPAGELVAGWRDLLGVLDATQHLTGPVIEADGRLHTHVRAHHWRAGSVWTVFGHYVALVEDGRIAALTLQLFHEEGSRDIFKPAS